MRACFRELGRSGDFPCLTGMTVDAVIPAEKCELRLSVKDSLQAGMAQTGLASRVPVSMRWLLKWRNYSRLYTSRRLQVGKTNGPEIPSLKSRGPFALVRFVPFTQGKIRNRLPNLSIFSYQGYGCDRMRALTQWGCSHGQVRWLWLPSPY